MPAVYCWLGDEFKLMVAPKSWHAPACVAAFGGEWLGESDWARARWHHMNSWRWREQEVKSVIRSYCLKSARGTCQSMEDLQQTQIVICWQQLAQFTLLSKQFSKMPPNHNPQTSFASKTILIHIAPLLEEWHLVRGLLHDGKHYYR